MKIRNSMYSFLLGGVSVFLILMILGGAKPNLIYNKYQLVVKDDEFYVLNSYTGEIKIRSSKYVMSYDWKSNYAEGQLYDLKLK